MKSLALVVRTLREDQRLPVQWVLRSVLVAVVLIVLIVIHRSRGTVGAAGRVVFQALVWTNFWFLAVVGSSLFSSVITEEKEQGTLGLLKLAGFGAPSILLGKSVGELCSAALLLGVQLPFAMLTITLGGVSPHQVLAVFVHLGTFMVAVHGLALFSSVVCQRTSGATRLTGVLVSLMTFGGMLVTLVLFLMAPSAGFTQPVWLAEIDQLSPYRALGRILSTGFDDALVTPAVLANLGVGAVAMLLGALWFPRATARDVPVAPPRAPWSWRLARRSRPGPGASAVAWKEFHVAGLGRLGWWLRVGVVVTVLVLTASITSNWGSRYNGVGMVCVVAMPWMLLLFVLDAGNLAGRLFQEEIRWHTLPGLFTLPIPLSRWALAKTLGALRLAAPTLAGLLLTVAVLWLQHGVDHLAETASVAVYITSVVLFGLQLTAYLSLRMRRGAFAVALASCIAGNGLLFGCGVSWFARSSIGRGDSVIGILWVGAVVLTMFAVAMQFAILRRLRAHAVRQG